MKKFLNSLVIFVLIFSFIFSFGCSGERKVYAENLLKNYTRREVVCKIPDEKFISTQYSFAVNLFKNSVSLQEKKDNILISPLSVGVALSMLINGAEGETLSELLSLFGLSDNELNAYYCLFINKLISLSNGKFHLANSVWIRDIENFTVKEDFLQKDVDYYNFDIYKENFDNRTLNDINNWVYNNTGFTIDKILDSIYPEDLLFLINATYLDYKWEREFPDVENGKFNGLNGDDYSVKMLVENADSYIESDNVLGFTKKYKGNDLEFIALSPKTGSIYDYVNSLTGENLFNDVKSVKREDAKIKLPEFSYEFETDLCEVLNNLGVNKAFTVDAEFSKMAEYEPGSFYVGQIKHKTFIDLSKEGTKASAVTEIGMKTETALIPKKNIVFDKPFLYLITDSFTGIPLYVGITCKF